MAGTAVELRLTNETGAQAGVLPSFVTFTGLDEWADMARVRDLSQRYPIEWGILFSPKRQGVEPRYPSLQFIDRIVTDIAMARGKGRMRLAAHLCGGYAHGVIEHGHVTIVDTLIGNFSRFQINTAKRNPDTRLVRRFAEDMNIAGQAILQTRDGFPDDPNVDWLFDRSGGRGETPSIWPDPPKNRIPFVGYAGGLGPDTVAAALEKIAPRHDASRRYWIDMESAIRTDDRLNLDKCEAVCRAVYDATPSALPPEPAP